MQIICLIALTFVLLFFITDGILNFVMMRKTIDLSWIYHASSKLNSVFIMRLNGISMRYKLRANVAICCPWFCYICICIRFHVLWVVELIYRCGGTREHFVWSIKQLLPSPLPLYFSTVYQGGRGGSWLGCQVLPTSGAVSI